MRGFSSVKEIMFLCSPFCFCHGDILSVYIAISTLSSDVIMKRQKHINIFVSYFRAVYMSVGNYIKGSITIAFITVLLRSHFYCRISVIWGQVLPTSLHCMKCNP